MDRNLAAQLLKAARSLDGGMGAIDEVVGRIPDETEREEYRQALAGLIDLIATRFVFQIFREHPDLDDEK